MNDSGEVFEVLGHKLKLKKDEKLDGVAPKDIVATVQEEASKIFNSSPQINPTQVAILLALKFAGEKLALEIEYRKNIDYLSKTASLALLEIDEVTPGPLL